MLTKHLAILFAIVLIASSHPIKKPKTAIDEVKKVENQAEVEQEVIWLYLVDFGLDKYIFP